MSDSTSTLPATYTVVGQIYYRLYRSTIDRFLGLAWADWLRLLTLLLVPYLWLQTGAFPWLAAALALGVRLCYGLAASRSYMHFVPEDDGVPTESPAKLPPDQRLEMRATGVFHVSDREYQVLLRPAVYWQAPLGTHIVMVERRPDSYLYQRFKPDGLLAVQPGWLLFGPEPLAALAVTFQRGAMTQQPQPEQFAFGQSASDESLASKKYTVYLTFDDAAAKTAVYQNILHDLSLNKPA